MTARSCSGSDRRTGRDLTWGVVVAERDKRELGEREAYQFLVEQQVGPAVGIEREYQGMKDHSNVMLNMALDEASELAPIS